VRRLLLLLAALAGVAVAGEGARRLPADRDAPVLYVALGDSTVAGVGATAASQTYVGQLHRRLRTVYPRASVVNLGVAGATSADVLARQLPEASRLAPQLVTLSIGPNDITSGVSVERYDRNVEGILAALGRETAAVVIVNLLPDLAITPRFRKSEHEAEVGALTVRFNRALRAVARRHAAEVVDLYGPSRREVPADPGLLAADGYHPSDTGYARWAALMWRGIERRLPDPRPSAAPPPRRAAAASG
jgi:lysophospholipase L1-like esterase